MVLFTVPTWLNPSWGQPSEGSIMKRLLLASLLLGSVSVAQAQVSAPILQIDKRNAAPDFSATSAAKATLLSDLAAADSITVAASKPANTFAAPTVATALALPFENAEPASPSPQPRDPYGRRDDDLCELGLADSWWAF